jgi:phosphatidylserine decarboxylase
MTMVHQYIDRQTCRVMNEKLYGDALINLIFGSQKESAQNLYNALASPRTTRFLSFLNFGIPGMLKGLYARRLIRQLGIDVSECVDRADDLNSPRKIFERKIRYWETRPLPDDPDAVVSPADAKMLVGSFSTTRKLFLKEKFFEFQELIGDGKYKWFDAFTDGLFAVFRLTPEKYHYNHAPVSGKVLDIYEIEGLCHSCNPSAVVAMATPYSKNRRVVTIIDTDVEDGSRAGLVAMIEITALLIGDIVQCHSRNRYDDPRPIEPGTFLKAGNPKSLYRPGSSVDVLIFQKDRIRFCEDIVFNMYHAYAKSRLSNGFGRPLVETDVKVRSMIARRQDRISKPESRSLNLFTPGLCG